jgi:hypothetical protein
MFRMISAVLALVSVVILLAQSVNASPNDAYFYSSRDGCMYRGYPCSEWTRHYSY